MYPKRFLSTAEHCLAALFVLSVCAGVAFSQKARTYPFYYATGSNPQGGLVADAAGNLYGTTMSGGALLCNNNTVGCGVVLDRKSVV